MALIVGSLFSGQGHDPSEARNYFGVAFLAIMFLSMGRPCPSWASPLATSRERSPPLFAWLCLLPFPSPLSLACSLQEMVHKELSPSDVALVDMRLLCIPLALLCMLLCNSVCLRLAKEASAGTYTHITFLTSLSCTPAD